METMELLGSTKSKITKNENGENVPHLEITEVVLLHCNIVNNNYQKNSRLLCTCMYRLKVKNRNTRTRCEICSKLTINTPERRQWCHSNVSIIDC